MALPDVGSMVAIRVYGEIFAPGCVVAHSIIRDDEFDAEDDEGATWCLTMDTEGKNWRRLREEEGKVDLWASPYAKGYALGLQSAKEDYDAKLARLAEKVSWAEAEARLDAAADERAALAALIRAERVCQMVAGKTDVAAALTSLLKRFSPPLAADPAPAPAVDRPDTPDEHDWQPRCHEVDFVVALRPTDGEAAEAG